MVLDYELTEKELLFFETKFYVFRDEMNQLIRQSNLFDECRDGLFKSKNIYVTKLENNNEEKYHSLTIHSTNFQEVEKFDPDFYYPDSNYFTISWTETEKK